MRSGGTARILGFLRDLSAERRVEQARLARSLVDQVLEQEPDLEAAAERILEAIGASLQWKVGVLWSYDAKARVLRCLRQWRAPDIASDGFGEVVAAATFAAGAGLPRKAWSSGEPVWAPDFIAEEDSSRALAAARVGLRSAAA